MTLRPEIVLAKATAGHPLTMGGGNAARMVSRPEYAIYLRGLKNEPLWLLRLMYADDKTRLSALVDSIRTDLELNFELHDVEHPRVQYQRLAVKLLMYYVTRGRCPACGGTGRSQWHVRACGPCAGTGATALRDKDVAAAAGLSGSTYSRKRATYNAIVGRVLAQVGSWHDAGLARIRRNIGP